VKKRGKILRGSKTGPGLLMLEGQQFPFSVSEAWRSEQAPAPGMSVEVEFGSAREILVIRPLSEIEVAKKVEGRASRIFGRLLAPKR
jgi:hypothetical protein